MTTVRLVRRICTQHRGPTVNGLAGLGMAWEFGRERLQALDSASDRGLGGNPSLSCGRYTGIPPTDSAGELKNTLRRGYGTADRNDPNASGVSI